MIKILLVEDDIKLNAFIKTVLEKNSYIVDSVYNPIDAITKMGNTVYNLIISDIMMPKMDGFEFVKTIRETDKDIPILLITAKDEFEDKRLSYSLGVDDYMVKPIDIKELILRIGALLRRAKINSEHKLQIGSVLIDYDSLTIKSKDEEILLPLKEFKILFKLLSSPNKIYTRSQIINDCWGLYSDSSDRTIDVHVTHLRERLKNITEFSIVTVRGLGYKAVIRNEK